MSAISTAFVGKLPRAVGGTEAPLLEQFSEIEARSFADGSDGWNFAFTGSSAGMAAARLPDAGVAEVLASSPGGAWPTFCGTFPLSGRATPCDGGYRLRGRWGFGSGIRGATWVACGALVEDTNAPAWFAVPAHEVTVHDTWDSPGLQGTQSCDYAIDDVFVPETRAFALIGAPRRGGALFALPTHAYLTPDHTAVSLGCARRALTECLAQARGNRRLGSDQALDHRRAFVRDAGRMHTRLAAATSHVRDVLARLDALVAGDPAAAAALHATAPLVLDARGAANHAAEVAVEVATFAYRNGGAHAVRNTSALGRAWRDTMTSTQHVHVLDDVYEWVGAALLEPPN
jgi:alkylation response protein AidB-like acyl-CoA dehydrogenase